MTQSVYGGNETGLYNENYKEKEKVISDKKEAGLISVKERPWNASDKRPLIEVSYAFGGLSMFKTPNLGERDSYSGKEWSPSY